MKKSLIALTVMLTAAVLVAVFSGPAVAKVTGRCDNCHTMHNSQGGTAMAEDRSSWYGLSPELGTPPYGTLLTDTCVGCHSHQSAVTYDLDDCKVPVVYTIGGIDFANCLAGGNFYWVAQGNHAKGHNVLGIAGQDSLSEAPGRHTEHGDPSGNVGCNDSCHESLAVKQTKISDFGSGCQGCHLRPAHHADDSNVVVGSEDSDDDGFYRFLSGHKSGDGFGVCGIEDSDWQATTIDGNDHNEYLGNAVVNLSTPAKMQSLGNTMTGFCCGCHGNFHAQNTESDGSGSWIRHPSDAAIKDKGEYAHAFDLDGNGTHIYNPLVPVARLSLSDSGPSDTVNIGSDMVMCLSCHVPHGSPNDDLLRWDYLGECEAGGPAADCGCMQCHTQKGTGG